MALMNFGERLAEARAKKALSQEQLAAKTKGEVSVKTISALEQGRIQNPRISTVLSLQSALGDSFFAEVKRYNAEAPEKEAKTE